MSEKLSPALGGARAWLIWSLSALAFGYAFFHRVGPSVMVSDLMREFAISGAVLGTLSALYFYPYVLMQIPLGALLDRLGARFLLTIALSIAALGSVLFGMAESLNVAYAGRIMIGIGSGVGFLGSLALAGKWFPPHRFAFLAGLAMFSGMTSGMLAQAPLALFVESYGWRASQWSLGAFGALLALAVFAFVRNSPTPDQDKADRSSVTMRDIWKGLIRASRIREVWKIAFVASAMSGPMLTLGGLWGTPYLMAAYDLARPTAAFLVSLMLLGWAFGAPFGGWLSHRIQKQKALLILGSGMLSLCIAIIALVPQLPLVVTVILLAVAGFSGGTMAITFALARHAAPSEIMGSVTGIVNSMTVASGAVLQPLVGLVLDAMWQGRLLDGSRFYEAADYRTGFLLVLATAILGFIIAILLKEPQAIDA